MLVNFFLQTSEKFDHWSSKAAAADKFFSKKFVFYQNEQNLKNPHIFAFMKIGSLLKTLNTIMVLENSILFLSAFKHSCFQGKVQPRKTKPSISIIQIKTVLIIINKIPNTIWYKKSSKWTASSQCNSQASWFASNWKSRAALATGTSKYTF